MLSISIKLSMLQTKKIAYIALLWVFALLSLNPSTHLSEELRLGPFKCKLSNLQICILATWLSKQTGVLLIL